MPPSIKKPPTNAWPILSVKSRPVARLKIPSEPTSPTPPLRPSPAIRLRAVASPNPLGTYLPTAAFHTKSVAADVNALA